MRVVAAADWQAPGDERVQVASDSNGRQLYESLHSIAESERNGVEIVLTDDTLAGAFHILDTLMLGYEKYFAWLGATSTRPLPPMFAYWKPDQTTQWSYYRGRQSSGRYMIELMAPRRDALDTADSDEHDEGIVLHEFGHFVFDWQSPATSRGGMHPRGFRVDPSTAFEEGRATWFACAVLGRPDYVDSEGRAPHGSARVNERIETPQAPRGAGSETSVAGVLWDLIDGRDSIADEDHDGIALTPAEVLQAMARMSVRGVAFRSLADVLRELTAVDAPLLRATLDGMLHATGEDPGALFSEYPISFVGVQTGVIDGLSEPAPSGGRNRPDNGFDAGHAYRILELPGGATQARLRLAIQGAGTPATHTDLDLVAYDENGRQLAESRGTGATEEFLLRAAQLPVVVYVQDGGGGNRARYELTLTATP